MKVGYRWADTVYSTGTECSMLLLYKYRSIVLVPWFHRTYRDLYSTNPMIIVLYNDTCAIYLYYYVALLVPISATREGVTAL